MVKSIDRKFRSFLKGQREIDKERNAFLNSQRRMRQAYRQREDRMRKKEERLAVQKPLEAAFDRLAAEESVTKIEVSQALRDVCHFSPERLSKLIAKLRKAGVKVCSQ